MARLILRFLACTLLTATAAGAASPVRILIAYHSRTGNTEKMAAAVREGAASVAGVEIVLRKVAEVTSDDIVKADGIVLGTPVEWGNLSAEAKRFLDRVGEALGKAGTTWERAGRRRYSARPETLPTARKWRGCPPSPHFWGCAS